MNKQEVILYGNDHRETHEIYAVFASKDKRLLYIGEGLKDRHKHTFSGHSHVKALNTIHKREVPVIVEVFGVKDKARAQELEDSLIKSLQPRYNVLAKEFYLNKTVKDTLTPIFRSEMLIYLKETLEISDSNLKTLITDKSESFERYFKSLQIEGKEIKEESTKPSSLTYLTMPAGSKYLSDKLPDTLPQNCLFDKVLTGCGGTFVALASYQPYIVAVPTKALVYDKVTSNTYSSFNIQGVSEDFPLSASRDFSKSTKIITTYKSLKSLCERSDVDISKYHLLIDEVHMLSSMTSYAKDELHWILNNFKKFKSYCFMSATMPRADHLLPELRDLNRVLAVWLDLTPVQFNCYVATKIQDSLLEIMYQHKIEKREGTPYFFYNSVTAICNLVKAWNQQDKVPATFNIICGDTDVNRSKLRAVGQEIGKPNTKADFHFITATAFEGVDFYDPEGVTYIISDRSYATTKYSIETTIPQIVGRLRDSKYNQEVTVIYNQHNTSIAMTPREFANYLDDRELNTKRSIEIYNELKSSVKTDKYLRDTLESTLKSLVDNPYALVEGFIKDFEDLVTEYDFQSDVYPNIEYYPYTKIIAQQTYDLFHEERYVRGGQKALGDPLSLGKLKGDAPDLSDETAELFKKKSVGLKVICNLYEKDPKACKDKYPEWYDVIETLGVEAIAKASYFKRKVKKMAEAKVTIERPSIQQQIFNAFKVGECYSSSYIRSVLEKIDGIHSRKATALRVWFQMEAFMKNNRTHYRIIRKL